MAIVLFDGSMPSLKALEAGCASGFFGTHTRDQVVILHATPPSAAALNSAAAASASISLAASATAGAAAVAALTLGATRGSVAVPSHQDEALLAAVAAASSSAAGATAASLAAISQVVDNIQKNRFASTSLNYKLETFRLSATMPQVLVAQRAATDKIAREQHLLEQQTAAPGTASSGRGAGGSNAASAAAASASAANKAQQAAAAVAAAASISAAAAHQQHPEPPTLHTVFAENVAERAKHHGSRTVLLGVGSSGGHGKALVVGGYARATIDRLRNSKEVDCIGIFKPSGPPVRSSQPMRIVIVATPTTTIDTVKRALSNIPYLSVSRGDFVGLLVAMNSGKPKPKSLVDALAALEQQRQQQAALGVGQGLQVQPATAQEQLSMIKVDAEGSEAGSHWRKTVGATLKLAGDVARLGFLNMEERLQQITQMTEQRNREDERGEGEGGDSARSGGAAPVANTAPSVAFSAASTSAGFEGPHLLTAFWIEPTNRDLAPDLESHTGSAQLGKAAAALKTDYCVIPSSSDPNDTGVLGPLATSSLLSVVRPHVLLV